MEFIDVFSTNLPQKVMEEYCSRSKPGADKISYKQFKAGFEQEIVEIKNRILEDKYKFTRFEVMLKAKKHYKLPRLIFKSSIRDRLVAKLMSEYLYMHYSGRGYVPTKTRDGVLTTIQGVVNETLDDGAYKYNYFLRLDISNYFDSINRHLLYYQLAQDELDKHFMCLVKKILFTMDISMDFPSGKGVPQGISISSILAERYLKALDEKYMVPRYDNKVCFVRYVDDILILTSDEEMHRRIKKESVFELQSVYGLLINPDKISEGELGRDAVDFLGTSIRNRQICISDGQIARIRAQLDELFMWYRRVCKTRKHPLYEKKDRALKSLIERLNLLITGYIYHSETKEKTGKYGWIQTSLPRQINNIDALKLLDRYVGSLILTHIHDDEQRESIKQKRKSFYMAYCKSKYTENEDGYILDREIVAQDETMMYEITCNLSIVDLKYDLGDKYDKDRFEKDVGESLYRHFCKSLYIANRDLTTDILYW